MIPLKPVCRPSGLEFQGALVAFMVAIRMCLLEKVPGRCFFPQWGRGCNGIGGDQYTSKMMIEKRRRLGSEIGS